MKQAGLGLLMGILLCINIIAMWGVFNELNPPTVSLRVEKKDKMQSPKGVGPRFLETFAHIHTDPIEADMDLSKLSSRQAFLAFFLLKWLGVSDLFRTTL